MSFTNTHTRRGCAKTEEKRFRKDLHIKNRADVNVGILSILRDKCVSFQKTFVHNKMMINSFYSSGTKIDVCFLNLWSNRVLRKKINILTEILVLKKTDGLKCPRITLLNSLLISFLWHICHTNQCRRPL